MSTINTDCIDTAIAYIRVMPKLWSETVDLHRFEVRDAILEATLTLVADHGLRSVTMSQIAEEAGIGRATLYKYFPSVEAILVAWHERHATAHLEHLAQVRDRTADARERVKAVLGAYALISYEQRDAELAAVVHQGEPFERARRHLSDLIRDLLAEAATAGVIREDVAPEELASYCLHALAAASGLPSRAAVRRLVTVTLAGLAARA